MRPIARSITLPPRRTRARAALAIATAALAVAGPAAASGGIDAGFGDGGLVISPVEDDEQPQALVPWGADLTLVGKSWGPSTSRMQVVRFNAQGDLRDVLHIAPGVASSGIRDAVVDTEGRLVVGGFAFADTPGGLTTDAAFARLLPDGTLDASFTGGGACAPALDEDDAPLPGVIACDVAAQDDEAFGLLALDDGGVLAVGRTSLPVTNGFVPTRAALWRLDADGGLTASRVIALAGEQDSLVALARDPQGRFVAVGSAIHQAGDVSSLAAARFDGALTLDATFGDLGVGLYDPGAYPAAVGAAIAVQGERIILGATLDNGAELPDFDLAAVAIDDDGGRDRSWADDGVFAVSVHTLRGTSTPSPDLLRTLLLDDAGRATLVGDSEGRFVMVRGAADGTLDTEFGNDGLVRVDTCGPTGLVADAVREPDGIVVAGACFRDPFFADAVLVRVVIDDDPPAGEGEGEGEGDPPPGEGEGEAPPLPGAEGEGEREDEGDPRPGCGCTGTAPRETALFALVALGVVRARRRLAAETEIPTSTSLKRCRGGPIAQRRDVGG